MQDTKIENILNSLSKSNFRNKFYLKQKDKEYIEEVLKGVEDGKTVKIIGNISQSGGKN